MRIYICLLIIFSVFIYSCKDEGISEAQADYFTKFFGSSGEDIPGDIKITSDNGYIMVGTLSGSTDKDIVIIKTDEYGNPVWEKIFGDTLDDLGNSIQATSDGNYIVLGTSYSTTELSDMYLLKIDASGNLIWENKIGGIEKEEGNCIQETSNNEFILVGTIYNDPEAPNSSKNIFLVRASASGDSLWAKQIGGNNDEVGNYVIQNGEKFAIIGSSESFAEPGQANSNIFIFETNDNGIPTNLMTHGGMNNDYGNSIQVLSDGSYIFAGTTSSYGGGSNDAYIAKTQPGDIRTLIWTNYLGDSKNETGNYIQQVDDGGFVMIGSTESYGNGDRDIYLSKIGSDGSELFYTTYGGVGADQGAVVLQTDDSGFIIFGSTGFENNSMLCLTKTNSEGKLE